MFRKQEVGRCAKVLGGEGSGRWEREEAWEPLLPWLLDAPHFSCSPLQLLVWEEFLAWQTFIGMHEALPYDLESRLLRQAQERKGGSMPAPLDGHCLVASMAWGWL